MKSSACSQNCSIALGSNFNQGSIRRFANGHTRTIPCEMQYVQNRKVAARRSRQRVPTVKMIPEKVKISPRSTWQIFPNAAVVPQARPLEPGTQLVPVPVDQTQSTDLTVDETKIALI